MRCPTCSGTAQVYRSTNWQSMVECSDWWHVVDRPVPERPMEADHDDSFEAGWSIGWTQAENALLAQLRGEGLALSDERPEPKYHQAGDAWYVRHGSEWIECDNPNEQTAAERSEP